MAQTLQAIYRSFILTNLDTYNHTAGLTSLYTVALRLNEIPPSGVTVVIQQNSVTKASLSAPAASQSHMELQTLLSCTAGDIITVILSSSVNSDELPNSIQANLIITPGLVP